MIASSSGQLSAAEHRRLVGFLVIATLVAGILTAFAALRRGSGAPIVIAVGLAEVGLLATAFLSKNRGRAYNWFVAAAAAILLVGVAAFVLFAA